MTTDGRWSNGVLSGAWRKDQAGYIGEGAREAARRARIEQLERELDAERAAIEGLDADLADIAARQNRLADEHRSVPPDDGVREAHTKAAERARTARAGAHGPCGGRRAAAAAAGGAGGRAGAGGGIRGRCRPARGPGELAAVRDGLGAYRVALAALWPAAEAAHAAIRAAAEAETELADSRQLLLEASERAAEAREAAGAAATTYQELLATVGTAVEELQRRLAEVTDALGRLRHPSGTPVSGNRARSRRAARRTGNRANCGRRSRMRRGCGTTRCASSRRSPPPGCCGSR